MPEPMPHLPELPPGQPPEPTPEPPQRSRGANTSSCRPTLLPVLQGCPSSKVAQCPRVALPACALCKGVLLRMALPCGLISQRAQPLISGPWAHNPRATATRCATSHTTAPQLLRLAGSTSSVVEQLLIILVSMNYQRTAALLQGVS